MNDLLSLTWKFESFSFINYQKQVKYERLPQKQKSQTFQSGIFSPVPHPGNRIYLHIFFIQFSFRQPPKAADQLNERLNSNGVSLVLLLNNLLKDCACSNPRE